MAHRCFYSQSIENMTRIAVHPAADHLTYGKGMVNFIEVNPKPSERMIGIPRAAKYVLFRDFWRYRGWIDYGQLEFLDEGGNVLKTTNTRISR